MPPSKKAAKKPNHDEPAGKDRRRAHEHLGRVEALHSLVNEQATQEITTLTGLGRQAIEAAHMKEAAELLRAAEHLSFGSLRAPVEEGADPALVDEMQHEFEGKLKKANEHWSDKGEHPADLEAIFHDVTTRAQRAFEAGSYRQALELARGAEALGHAKPHGKGKKDAKPIAH